MLHILLTIIKIIGIILAGIFGLVILLLCLLLFVPVRYHLTGVKTKERLDGKGQVSWLLKMICVNFYLKNQEFHYEIRIFGITLEHISHFLKKVTSFFRRKKKESAAAPEKKNKEIPKTDAHKTGIIETDLLHEKEISSEVKSETSAEARTEARSETGSEVSSVKNEKKEEGFTDHTAVEVQQKRSIAEIAAGAVVSVMNKITALVKQLLAFVKKILAFPGKILDGFHNMRLTIRSICDKINQWIHFLREETTQEAWILVKTQCKKLIKHIIPRKIRGNVTFGFEDPATTGQVLAGICVFYPLYYKQINISPDFTQTIFIGDLELKGRIYLWMLLKTGLRVYFDKNIQYIKNRLSNNSNKKKV